ncbi:MAG TPA: hypothetical protein VFB76_10795 [Candidatus Angelobacter sp.]|nr:hypothetical protein [Candidatus Angelobacter sp.]
MTKPISTIGIHLLLGILVFSGIGMGQDSVVQGTCTFRSISLVGPLFSVTAINDVGAVVGSISNGGVILGFLSFNNRVALFTFPGDSIQTFPNDINNHAQIVGSYDSISRGRNGFLVHDGGFQTIKVPNSSGTNINGISDKGDIVGAFSMPGRGLQAFLLHNGHFTSFSVPGALSTQAGSINIHGQIVGTYHKEGQDHGFMVRNGVFTFIDFPGATDTELNKINNEGDIVGQYSNATGLHGFAFDKGRFVTLDDRGSGSEVGLAGVNNLDQVITKAERVGDCHSQF